MNSKEKIKETSQGFITTFQMTKYVLKTVYKDQSGKIYTWIKILLIPIFSLIPLLYVIVPGMLINELTEKQRIEKLILYVSLIVLTPVLHTVINLLSNKYL